MPPEPSEQTVDQGLALMARYLAQRHADVTVVATGDAVDKMLFDERYLSSAIDLFGSHLNTGQRRLLDEAATYAKGHCYQPFRMQWFDSDQKLSDEIHRHLTQEALYQNVIVFSQPGLTVLAPPWRYAFSAKAERLMQRGRHAGPEELGDVVVYLNEVVDLNGGLPEEVDGMLQSSAKYGHDLYEKFLLLNVNFAYQQRYGRPGIVKGWGRGGRR